jgi:hypothetical protein
MKTTRRFSIALGILGLVMAILACSVFPTPEPSNLDGANDQSEPLAGDGTGKLDTKYKVWVNNQEMTPVCTDDKAEFHMTVVPTDSIPKDTLLKNGVPKGYSYLRLEVYAAEYSLDKGECDYSGDRSDSVAHYILEGGYSTASGTYVILSCGKDLTLEVSALQGYTPNALVDGYVICSRGDQIRLIFTLNTLQLYLK